MAKPERGLQPSDPMRAADSALRFSFLLRTATDFTGR